jgi:hypothetical protein
MGVSASMNSKSKSVRRRTLLDRRRNEIALVGDVMGLFDLGRGPFRCAPVERLARINKMGEGADNLLHRHTILATVREDDIDVVGS